jgi:hypothetical protein
MARVFARADLKSHFHAPIARLQDWRLWMISWRAANWTTVIS